MGSDASQLSTVQANHLMTKINRYLFLSVGAFQIAILPSCAYISDSGPIKGRISKTRGEYELIAVDSRDKIPSQGRVYGRADKPPVIQGQGYSDKIRERESLIFVITDLSEQSPFFRAGEPYKYGPIEVPGDGVINIPYVGELSVLNRSLSEISNAFSEKIKPVSNTAQVTVLRTERFLLTANVMGEVKAPGPVLLQRSGITSIDILAASGGPSNAEHLYKYILRRGGHDYEFDYKGFRQNPFIVEAGDLLTVSSDASNRFQVMGAIYNPVSVAFPVPNPTLSDAIGAAKGLDERRSDASGIFVFRKGNPDIVYTFDLKDPNVMSLLQRFPIQGQDIVYVTEAPLTRWNRMLSQILPGPVTQAARTATE
jgi:protein involved in polysaccharide export with SLBB domain